MIRCGSLETKAAADRPAASRQKEVTMYYHASPVGGIRVLEPRPSNHGVPLVYFSDRRENVLVYLSNAVEKVCREAGFAHTGPWAKWASYGFEPDGRLRVEEYYPDALEDTYRGVGGTFIPAGRSSPARMWTSASPMPTFPPGPPRSAAASGSPTHWRLCSGPRKRGTSSWSAIRSSSPRPENADWLRRTIREEYAGAGAQPDYRFFLKRRFGALLG